MTTDATAAAAYAQAVVHRSLVETHARRVRLDADIDPLLSARIYAIAEQLRPDGRRRAPLRAVIEAILTVGIGPVEAAVPMILEDRDVRETHARQHRKGRT